MTSEKIIAIITGPSAVGKSTIAKAVLKKLKKFKPSVSYTTRTQRRGDTEDKIMHYVNEKKFRELIDDGQLVEWAQVYGHFYGTSKIELKKILEKNNVLLNIDVQGAKNIKKKFPKNISIFIMPENMTDIADRLKSRHMPLAIKKLRLQAAKNEIAQADLFDYRIVNRNNHLNDAVNKIIKILKKY